MAAKESDSVPDPAPFTRVLDEEKEWIGGWRQLRNSSAPPPSSEDVRDCVGVAFSGGGIRSATFNLGVLQALARAGALRWIDYLSSVSGGSYINSWFAAWVHRDGFDHVEESLAETEVEPAEGGVETNPQIAHLRRYSNYLTPRTGIASSDTWAAISGYLIRLLPNVLAVLLVALSLVLAPYAVRNAVKRFAVSGGAMEMRRSTDLQQLDDAGNRFSASLAAVHQEIAHPAEHAARLSELGQEAERELMSLVRRPADVPAHAEALKSLAFSLNYEAAMADADIAADPRLKRVLLNAADDFSACAAAAAPGLAALRRCAASASALRVEAGRAITRWDTQSAVFSSFEDLYESARVAPFDSFYSKVGLRQLGRLAASIGPDTEREAALKAPVTSALSAALNQARMANVQARNSISRWLQDQATAKWALRAELPRPPLYPLAFAIAGALLLLALPLHRVLGAHSMENVAGIVALQLFGVAMLLAVILPFAYFWTLRTLWIGAFAAVIIAQAGFGILTRPLLHQQRIGLRRIALAAFFGSVLGAALLTGVLSLCRLAFIRLSNLELAIALLTAATPLVLIAVYLGMAAAYMVAINLPNVHQERFNRVWGGAAMLATEWLALAAVVLLAPMLIIFGGRTAAWLHSTWGLISSAVTWLAATGAGIASAFSGRTGKKQQEQTRPVPLRQRLKLAARRTALLERFARLAPTVFLVGLFALLSLACSRLITSLADRGIAGEYFGPAWLASILLALLLCCMVDVNRLSLHNLYRFRLGECYLEASVMPSPDAALQRQSLPLRDLDGEDARPAPYPLINAALNVTSKTELSVQGRKAYSFFFSPRFCGYSHDVSESDGQVESRAAFRPTREFASSPDPLPLAAALSISGAAQSPNEGAHSSPPVAFLLTMANVRLGWWIGNPARNAFRQQTPRSGLRYMMMEMLGSANDRRDFVYLSDGGHFENLGIYELVRRRCKLIIACDADQDPGYSFGDLMNAVEKCRADFCADIRLNTDPLLSPGEPGYSTSPFVIGTIRYKERRQQAQDQRPAGEAERRHDAKHHPHAGENDGLLIYLKTAVTAANSPFVRDFDRRNAAFPHEPTTNQWFDEAEFEAYRLLGLESAGAMLHALSGHAPPWWPADAPAWDRAAQLAREALGLIRRAGAHA